jgi:hypothetical protein
MKQGICAIPNWEHKVEQLANYFDADGYIEQLRIALAAAGAEGWEFVTAVSSEGPASQPDLLIFRRPVSD